jgi:hypothetical protein
MKTQVKKAVVAPAATDLAFKEKMNDLLKAAFIGDASDSRLQEIYKLVKRYPISPGHFHDLIALGEEFIAVLEDMSPQFLKMLKDIAPYITGLRKGQCTLRPYRTSEGKINPYANYLVQVFFELVGYNPNMVIELDEKLNSIYYSDKSSSLVIKIENDIALGKKYTTIDIPNTLGDPQDFLNQVAKLTQTAISIYNRSSIGKIAVNIALLFYFYYLPTISV